MNGIGGPMEIMIAYCGLDCAGCEAFIATQADDLAAKKIAGEVAG